MNTKQTAIIVLIAIIFGAGGFYGGTVYQKSKVNAGRPGREGNFMMVNGERAQGQGAGQGSGRGRMMMGPGGVGGNNANGDFAAGEIIAKDDKSITIKTRDGGSKIVYFSDQTKIGKAVDGAVADLGSGQEVMVNGKNNADGSLAAQNIQIRPEQSN